MKLMDKLLLMPARHYWVWQSCTHCWLALVSAPLCCSSMVLWSSIRTVPQKRLAGFSQTILSLCALLLFSHLDPRCRWEFATPKYLSPKELVLHTI